MWILRLVLEYLNFVLRAKSPSAMHSPYLYDLLPHAFDETKAYYAFSDIELARHMLRESETPINSPDQGAGSRRNYKRTVGEFVQAALSSPRQCEVLFRLAERLRPKVIIELGAGVGISTAYLASAARSGIVHAFEANPQFVRIAQDTIHNQGIHNVNFIEGNFDNTLQSALATIGAVDLAFIDGNHKYEPTLSYFNMISEHASDRAIIIIDDIRWSPQMIRAWNEIASDERVRVAIDAFSFGLIFLGSRFKDKEYHKVSPSLFRGGPILG